MKRVAIALGALAALAIVTATGQRALAGPTSYPIGAHVAEKYNIPTSRSIQTVGLRSHGCYQPHHGYHYRHPHSRYYYRSYPPVYRHYGSYAPYSHRYYRPYSYGRPYWYSPHGVSVYGRHFGLSIGF
jgi:hypothetical protein